MAGKWGRVGVFLAVAEVFYLTLSLAFPLAELYARVPPVDFAKLTDYKLWASGGMLLVYLVLFGLLAVLVAPLLGARRARALVPLSPRFVLAAGLVFALTLLPLYPIFAIDMLMYGVRSRLWLLYGANPLLTPPAAFPTDPWVGLTGEWITATSGYSPLWEWVALIPAWIAGPDRFLLHLWGLKMIALLAYALDAWLVYRVAGILYPDSVTPRVMYFAWNPLVLLELVGNGHNDGLMLAFVLLALWLTIRGREVAAHVALAGGVLIKVTPLFLWPVLWLWGMARRRGWKERIRYTGVVAVIVLVTLAIFALFLWPDPTPWQALRESDISSRAPQTLFILLAMAAQVPHAYTRVQAIFRGVFVLAYAAVLLWFWRAARARIGEADRAPQTLVHAWLAVLVLLLLIFASNWRPWYTTWLLALAALSSSPAWTRGAFALSFTAATGDVYWTNLRWRFGEYITPLIAHLIGVPYVFGVPVAWALRHVRRGSVGSFRA